MLISAKDICLKIPVARTMIYALIARHDFPKPIKVGRRSFWEDAEVQKWIDTQYSNRDKN